MRQLVINIDSARNVEVIINNEDCRRAAARIILSPDQARGLARAIVAKADVAEAMRRIVVGAGAAGGDGEGKMSEQDAARALVHYGLDGLSAMPQHNLAHAPVWIPAAARLPDWRGDFLIYDGFSRHVACWDGHQWSSSDVHFSGEVTHWMLLATVPTR